MSRALYIAAKAPRPGLVKTRLAREIGDSPAVALYRAFLVDLASRFADGPFALGWYLTPRDAWRELAPLVGATAPARVLPQGGGDWTERQRRLFRTAPLRGETHTVLVASDSPQLEAGAVADAFEALERHDVVVGPVADGGYCLLGMRGWHDVLRGVAMSTGDVTRTIETRARAARLSVVTLAETFDVDTVADLHALRPLARSRSDLAATQAALESLGLARPDVFALAGAAR